MTEMIAHNIDELGDFWAKAVYPFIRPIVEADWRERPSPTGSGILVSCYAKHYLLTAHHITAPLTIPGAGDANGALYTFIPEQVEIVGVNLHVPDPFDLSMTEIPTATSGSLRLPQHLALDVQEGELCLLVGYPARSKSWQINQTKQTLRPAPLSYVGRVFKNTTGHFSVRFSRKHVYRSGNRLPRQGKLNGISGGGAFILRGDMPKLAGIIIEYHSNRSEIVCTSAIAVWEMVRQLGALLKSECSQLRQAQS